MFFSVSSAVSPLVVDEVEASKFRMSAPSRCAARWKLSRVRVEGSKNSVHTAVPASERPLSPSTRSEEHTSERQSLMRISYAVFCLKKKQITPHDGHHCTHDSYTLH